MSDAETCDTTAGYKSDAAEYKKKDFPKANQADILKPPFKTKAGKAKK